MQLSKKKSLTLIVTLIVALVVGISAAAFLWPSDAERAKKVKQVVRVSPTSSSVTIRKGDSIKLKAACKPSKVASKYKKLKFTSSNKKIATVSSSGTVKGKKNGTVTIKAINSYSGLNAKWKVKVYSSISRMSMTGSTVLYNITMSDLKVSSNLRTELANVVKACGGASAAFNNQSYIVRIGNDAYRLTYSNGTITNTKNNMSIQASDLQNISINNSVVRFGNTKSFRTIIALVADNAGDYRSSSKSSVHVKFNGKSIAIDNITFNRGHVQFKTSGTTYDAAFENSGSGRLQLNAKYVSGKARSFSSTTFGKALTECGLFTR